MKAYQILVPMAGGCIGGLLRYWYALYVMEGATLGALMMAGVAPALFFEGGSIGFLIGCGVIAFVRLEQSVNTKDKEVADAERNALTEVADAERNALTARFLDERVNTMVEEAWRRSKDVK